MGNRWGNSGNSARELTLESIKEWELKGNHLNRRPGITQPPQQPVKDTSSKWQTKQRYRPSQQQTGLPPPSALSIRGKTNKQTKNQHKSHPIWSLHKPLDQTYGGRNQKEERIQPSSRKGIQLSLKPGKVKVKLLSRVWLFVTLWTVAHQSPLSMGFSRQEYWSGLPFPSPGDLKPWEKETSNTISFKKIMKRQRNTAQMKEQIRNTEVQINEEEIGKLPEWEFRIMIVKMAKGLKTKWRRCKNQLTKT